MERLHLSSYVYRTKERFLRPIKRRQLQNANIDAIIKNVSQGLEEERRIQQAQNLELASGWGAHGQELTKDLILSNGDVEETNDALVKREDVFTRRQLWVYMVGAAALGSLVGVLANRKCTENDERPVSIQPHVTPQRNPQLQLFSPSSPNTPRIIFPTPLPGQK